MDIHSRQMSMLKLMHLLKVTGKPFDMLKKPKSYLSRLEEIARHGT